MDDDAALQATPPGSPEQWREQRLRVTAVNSDVFVSVKSSVSFRGSAGNPKEDVRSTTVCHISNIHRYKRSRSGLLLTSIAFQFHMSQVMSSSTGSWVSPGAFTLRKLTFRVNAKTRARRRTKSRYRLDYTQCHTLYTRHCIGSDAMTLEQFSADSVSGLRYDPIMTERRNTCLF